MTTLTNGFFFFKQICRRRPQGNGYQCSHIRHGWSCRSRRYILGKGGFQHRSPKRVTVALLGAVAQADVRRVDPQGGRRPRDGARCPASSHCRSVFRTSTAPRSHGRRTEAGATVTGARGRLASRPPIWGGRYFIYRPPLGSREPSNRQRTARSERGGRIWCLVWASKAHEATQ